MFGAILAANLGSAPTLADSVAAYETVFRWTIPFMVVSLILGQVMREKPLSGEMVVVAEGKTEVPECGAPSCVRSSYAGTARVRALPASPLPWSLLLA